MILNIAVSPSTINPIASICTASLKEDIDSPPAWEKTTVFMLDNPEKVMNELLEMLEDIEPTGESEFKQLESNGIKAYVEANAIEKGLKLVGEKYDPEQRKLKIFATCAADLDKAFTEYLDAQSYMKDLYRNEPETGIERMTYMAKKKQKMPHWTNPTEEAYLHAVWSLNQAMDDARKLLESIGRTTTPETYPQTIASILSNLNIVQMMDIETSRRH